MHVRINLTFRHLGLNIVTGFIRGDFSENKSTYL